MRFTRETDAILTPMWVNGDPVKDIAMALGCRVGAVYARAHYLQLPRTRKPRAPKPPKEPKVFASRGLKCPSCGGWCDEVADSRPSDSPGFQTVRRRRACSSCDARITTFEVPDTWVEAATNYRNDLSARIASAAMLGLITPEIRKLLEGKP